MGEAMRLTDQAWRTLSIRWGFFFFAMAGLNEIVWRTLSTDQWVNFKVFGLLPLTLVFAVANAPYMTKHMIADDATKP
jgi:intracellular septation protein